MGWIFQDLGSASLLLTGYAAMTLNGPYLLGASFALGWVVFRLVASSHTESPSWKWYVGASCHRD
jgi:hypothetical protein